MKYAVLAGRQLFSLIFILSSARHFGSPTIASAAAHGVPLPDQLVPSRESSPWSEASASCSVFRRGSARVRW